MSEKVRWGIIGLGKIANKFASDLLLVENCELKAVASKDKKKAVAFAKEYDVNRYYYSYEELAADPEIDVVYIATINNLHFSNTMLCFENGKHVLCEKPLGLNSQEVTTMIAEAKSRNLFLMEALWTRFIPATRKVLELINKNTIGKISFIRADFGFKGNDDPKARLFNPELGGGSLLDIGIYPIYLSLLLLGMPNSIKSIARISKTNVDSYCGINFEYNTDQKAFLESTFEADTQTEAFIFGETGVIKMHRPFHHTKRISIYKNGIPDQYIDIDYKGHGYYYEIKEVNSCIRNSSIESPKVSLSLSSDLMTIMDKIRNTWHT